MKVCQKCKAKNPSGAGRCAKCGTLLDSTATGLAVDPQSLVGRVVNGKYKVLGILGEGGMGVVYKVRHLLLEKRNLFALKILHPRYSGDEHFRRRFMREVEVAMNLTHENIVQIRDFGITEDNLLFFTLDFFAGTPLSRFIRKHGRFHPRRVVRIARALLLALREAHRAGVVHRDLKPDNILVHASPDGDRVWILDFGIAKILEGDGQSDLTGGGMIGTPKYVSPEQASGEALDARSDLYSLGIVLYEMVSGKVPFSRGTARSVLMAQMTAPPPCFKEVVPDLEVPPALERFIFRLLAKNAAERPASATECLALLEGKDVPRSGRSASARRGRPKRETDSVRPVLLACLLAVSGIWLARESGYFDRSPEARAEPDTPATSGGAVAKPAPAPAPLPGAASDPLKLPPEFVPLEADAGGVGDRQGAPVPTEYPKLFRCLLCGKVYADREKLYNICHGEPMTEIEKGEAGFPEAGGSGDDQGQDGDAENGTEAGTGDDQGEDGDAENGTETGTGTAERS